MPECLNQIPAGLDRRIRTHCKRHVFAVQLRERQKIGVVKRALAGDVVADQERRCDFERVAVRGPLLEIRQRHIAATAGFVQYRHGPVDQPLFLEDALEGARREIRATSGRGRRDDFDRFVRLPRGVCSERATAPPRRRKHSYHPQ